MHDPEKRILLRPATSRDAIMACEVLARAGIHAQVCADIAELLAELPKGAGALMIAEELIAGDGLRAMARALAAQPPWSDLPVLVLARQGADSRAIARVMDEFANVTVIERPMRVAALVSAARSALRARRRQYELRSVLDGLRQADQRKNEFLATLAHELRNPLAPLTNALALLSRKPLAPNESQRVHELMRRQIDHMVRLVDDLMEVSRITRGKVELHRAPLLLQGVLDDALELSRPLLDASGQDMVVKIADASLSVSGDAVRLTQVFANLLNNAAKYTPGGGRIELSLRREAEFAVVEVKDSGVGLAPHMLDSVFEMFVQVSGTAKVAQGGLGIGLTLVKSLVEMHGGSVEAASPGLGRGATFTVRLPLLLNAQPQPAPPPALQAGPSAPQDLAAARTVLVVDDNHDAADSLAELLRVMGATALAAYSGDEALQMASRYRVDIAVLDIGMPVMDGCDLARRLRAHHGDATPRLIALTGWGQPADRERIARAGFDHHLLKPVDAADLMALL